MPARSSRGSSGLPRPGRAEDEERLARGRLLDWRRESVTLKETSQYTKRTMKNMRGCARLARRGGVAIIAAAVLVFCLSSVHPAMAQPAACQGVEPPARMCAQPGAAGAVDHLLGLVEQVLPAQWVPMQSGFVSPGSGDIRLTQFQLVPSAPRAPPSSSLS